MTPGSRRTAAPRRGWPGSTPARWARWATARSGCRSRRSPTRRPARCPGGCSCPSAGTMPARPRRRRPRRSATAASGPASRPISGIGRSGGWRWTCSTSWAVGNWPPPGGVQVRGALSAHAEDAVPALVPTSGRGRPSRPRYRTKPHALRAHVLAAGRAAARQITWREGSRGPKTSHFVLLRVRPAGHHQGDRRAADGSLPAVWLLAEWSPEAPEPTDYWLSSLPEDTPLAELVPLAKIRRRIRTH